MTDTKSRTSEGLRPSTRLDGKAGAAWAIEELRLAEARLARRRQQACGPSQTTREVLRIVVDEADLERPITPKELAHRVNITAAGLTAILKRLVEHGLIAYRPVPGDARSKAVVPISRNDPDAADPLTVRIRAIVDELDARDAEVVERVLRRVRTAVDEECAD